MAKDASFDVVSVVNMAEVRNAVDQTKREIQTRYDFKGTLAEIELEDGNIRILAENEHRLQAIVEILKGKCARREVPVEALSFNKPEPASGGSLRQRVNIRQGIDKETGKKIVARIKATKLKVQASMLEDQVRVSGKSRDDLQSVIALLKAEDFGLPLQFVNFRS